MLLLSKFGLLSYWYVSYFIAKVCFFRFIYKCSSIF